MPEVAMVTNNGTSPFRLVVIPIYFTCPSNLVHKTNIKEKVNKFNHIKIDVFLYQGIWCYNWYVSLPFLS